VLLLQILSYFLLTISLFFLPTFSSVGTGREKRMRRGGEIASRFLACRLHPMRQWSFLFVAVFIFLKNYQRMILPARPSRVSAVCILFNKSSAGII
jgi:hypothetical protein